MSSIPKATTGILTLLLLAVHRVRGEMGTTGGVTLKGPEPSVGWELL